MYTIEKNDIQMTVTGEAVRMVFYKYTERSTNIYVRSHATINGVALKVSYSGYSYIKSGRGRIKNEKAVFDKIDEVEKWISEQGYFLTKR